MPDRSWLHAVNELRRERQPGVLVTVAAARGHAPRRAGAKMVVAADRTWGSIGGGRLEALAIERARDLLVTPDAEAELVVTRLTDKVPYDHGVQCCGGEVTVLLDPLPTLPAVAIFGVGHVGLELARILARHDVELHLVDSRAGQLVDSRLAVLGDSVAEVHVHHLPVLIEAALDELPARTHVLIMTHDHAEDAALCDAALRDERVASIGLIGSASKWARFRRRLIAEGGHTPASVDRITTPIGRSDLPGKTPAMIALSVAADLAPMLTESRDGVGPGHVSASSDTIGAGSGSR